MFRPDPLVGLLRGLGGDVLVHEALGIGRGHGRGVHLHVAPELAVGVGVGEVGGEEHRRRHRLQLEVDARLLRRLLDDRLLLLPGGVDRRLVDELHLLAALLADAVGAPLPAGGVEDGVGLVDVELPLRVRRAEARRVVHEVGGGEAGAAVDEVLHALLVAEQGHRLAHLRVGEGEVLALHVPALALDLVPRIGDVELDELDVAAGNDVGLALAALLHALEHLVLDLQVPGVVVLAGLQHRARRRGGVAAALHLDRVEEGPVRHVVVLVDRTRGRCRPA